MDANLQRAASAAALCLALTLLAACDGSDPASTAPTAASAVDSAPDAAPSAASSPAQDAARLVADGNAAFRASRFVAPPGDNAFERFLSARDRDPAHLGAQEAIVEVFPLAVAAAERALDAGDAAEADRIAALLLRASPDSLAVRALRERIDAGAPPALRDDGARAPALEAAEAPAPPVAPAAAAPREPAAASTQEAPAPVAPPRATGARGVEVDAPPRADADATPQPPVAAAQRELAPPQVVLRVDPAYPQLARQRRIEGWVELDFLVGTDGRAQDIRVVESSPNAMFDTAAMRALERWRFEPARRGTVAEPMRSRTRITFRLG
jgi:protein TonB